LLKDIKYRWALIVFLLIASAYLIWPTYKLYTLSDDEVAELSIEALKELKEGGINLGLDLQGGMYVLLEVDIPILVEKLADKSTEMLKNAIRDAKKAISEDPSSESTLLSVKKAIQSLDKATQKGVIHKNNSGRKKSRLMTILNESLKK